MCKYNLAEYYIDLHLQMCENWRQTAAAQNTCEKIRRASESDDGDYTVKGYDESYGNSNLLFWAANPPTYVNSYTGSGLPFPNSDIAYENTVNKGVTKCKNGHYSFKLRFPNAYYKGLGTVYVEPCYHLQVCGSTEIKTITIGHGIPFRMMTYPPSLTPSTARTTPLFYKKSVDKLRTQEQILRSSSYPATNTTPSNFWGERPPN